MSGDKIWRVYGLVDPMDDQVFYVGISHQPYARFYSHKKDPCSAAWEVIQEIEARGDECSMVIIAEFFTKDEALQLEHLLIKTIPSHYLVNRDFRRYRTFPWRSI